MTMPKWRCAWLLLLMLPFAAAADEIERLRSIYPFDHHCLFVPPPTWAGIHDRSGDRLLMLLDRQLAMDAATRMKADRFEIAYVLRAEAGLRPSDLEEGGPLLRRALAANASQFQAAWRVLRDSARTGNPLTIEGQMAFLSRLCDRRALLVLTTTKKGSGAEAAVFSLITGNRVAQGRLDGF
ncbi:MAG: hypothetical protein ACFB6S_16935 [Geminicoccaceae bacterium]